LMLLHTKRTIGNNPKYMLMIAFASGWFYKKKNHLGQLPKHRWQPKL
jgi:hypothetical protein